MSSSRSTRDRIRKHRINLGESPEAFGARIGVAGQTIRRIEAGKALTVRSAFCIAGDLRLPVIDLWPPLAPNTSTRSPAQAP